MKKLSFLLLAVMLTAGVLTGCGNGSDTKAAADSSSMKKDTVVTPVDTTKVDTGKGRPIIPPNTKQ